MTADVTSLIAGFLAAARRHPGRPALAVDDVSYRYEELLERSTALSELIREADPDGSALVAVHGERSFWAYAGVLGALLAGRGYVPLPPSSPPDRVRQMLRRSGATTVVVAGASAAAGLEAVEDHPEELIVVVPDRDVALAPSRHRVLGADALSPPRNTEHAPVVSSEAIAYLLFTSGTTGEPKGIGIPHSRVNAYVAAAGDRFRVGPEDRCTQNFALTFDLSVHDMFVTWSAGACLCVPSQRARFAPARFVREHAITSWFSTPSTAAMMMKLRMLKPGAFPSLRWSLFCGEALPTDVADAWLAASPDSQLVNLYGPTEATIACTAYAYGGGEPRQELVNGVVPIGHPFGSTRVAIADQDGRATEAGPGELLLAGPQVAPGYWKDPERTAAVFVDAPDIGPGPWYRTGDLVSRGSSGDLMYHGRLDDQIKILGNRVELGEIESALRRVSGGAPSVALGWPRTAAGAEGIVAFMVADELDEEDVVRRCRDLLPDYMIPSRVHRLDGLPLTTSGKADRRRLAELHEELL